MSNVHGLFSDRTNNNSSASDDDEPQGDENNRYVGGVSARGGGSGLAVEPNPEHILDSIHATASAPESTDGPIQRRITMYRSGFVVDNGPYRRLDDPANSEFLKSLAKGVTPQELRENDDAGAGVVVGLEDKRTMEYEDDPARGGGGGTGGGAETEGFRSFSGAGQSLGAEGGGGDAEGVGVVAVGEDEPPEVDGGRPTTVVQVRLLSGRRLRVKVNCDSPVLVLTQHVNASGDAGEGNYVLSSGYPPRILDDLSVSIEDAGLKGAQVIQKKA